MEGKISKDMKDAPSLPNTEFKYDDFDLNMLQAHFERISDYFMQGKVYWKRTKGGVEFLDSKEERNNRGGPKLAHFRESSLLTVNKDLNKCWNKCVQDMKAGKLEIPLPSIKSYSVNGTLVEKITNRTYVKGKNQLLHIVHGF